MEPTRNLSTSPRSGYEDFYDHDDESADGQAYKPRTNAAEFIIPYDLEPLKNKYSIGMRIKLRFEGEEAHEQRFIGTIVGIEDHDPHKWPESKWRCLKARCSGMKLQRFQGLIGFHLGK
nr:auxin response factor 2-like [Ipomoea batatas]